MFTGLPLVSLYNYNTCYCKCYCRVLDTPLGTSLCYVNDSSVLALIVDWEGGWKGMYGNVKEERDEQEWHDVDEKEEALYGHVKEEQDYEETLYGYSEEEENEQEVLHDDDEEEDNKERKNRYRTISDLYKTTPKLHNTARRVQKNSWK